jgi:hypothetical protein
MIDIQEVSMTVETECTNTKKEVRSRARKAGRKPPKAGRAGKAGKAAPKKGAGKKTPPKAKRTTKLKGKKGKK